MADKLLEMIIAYNVRVQAYADGIAMLATGKSYAEAEKRRGTKEGGKIGKRMQVEGSRGKDKPDVFQKTEKMQNCQCEVAGNCN